MRLLRAMPESGLPPYSEGRVTGIRRDQDGAPTAVEIEFYQDSRTIKTEAPLDAVELVIARSGLGPTAVLWGVEGPPEELIGAAMNSMLDSGFLMRDGLNVARLYYHGDERWWKWGEKHTDPTGTLAITSGPAWDGCVVAFSGKQRFHLEFRLQGRGQAVVFLHERWEAWAEQARTTAPAMSLVKVLMNLWSATGASCCAFPVADPWLMDEDWRSLLHAPLYPDLFLLPEEELPKDYPEEFRLMRLSRERAMLTVLPIKAMPSDAGWERSARELKIDSLRKYKALGEKYYDQLYEHARFGTTGLYSSAKDAFYDAISTANELGMKQEADELSNRLDHIKAVFRSQFT
ncbi:MAG TPA: hypothetical protein VJW20_02145 [Candidatus Angelobacter sp.]|nr:hypothetical protein [Candidatus Angelobacter sp.]